MYLSSHQDFKTCRANSRITPATTPKPKPLLSISIYVYIKVLISYGYNSTCSTTSQNFSFQLEEYEKEPKKKYITTAMNSESYKKEWKIIKIKEILATKESRSATNLPVKKRNLGNGQPGERKLKREKEMLSEFPVNNQIIKEQEIKQSYWWVAGKLFLKGKGKRIQEKKNRNGRWYS